MLFINEYLRRKKQENGVERNMLMFSYRHNLATKVDADGIVSEFFFFFFFFE